MAKIDHLPETFRVVIYGENNGVLYDRELLLQELTFEQRDRIEQTLADGHVMVAEGKA